MIRKGKREDIGLHNLQTRIDALPGGKAASQRNALPIYDFANQRDVHHVLDRLPIRTGTLRAIGAFLNTFAIECFMDELARSAGLDPVDRKGFVFDPLGWRWSLSDRDLSVNYVTASTAPA